MYCSTMSNHKVTKSLNKFEIIHITAFVFHKVTPQHVSRALIHKALKIKSRLCFVAINDF